LGSRKTSIPSALQVWDVLLMAVLLAMAASHPRPVAEVPWLRQPQDSADSGREPRVGVGAPLDKSMALGNQGILDAWPAADLPSSARKDALVASDVQDKMASPPGLQTTAPAMAGAAVVAPGGNATALREGVAAVLEVDSPRMWDEASVTAFAQLRRGCLYVAGEAGAFHAESAHAPAVLNFMIDFAKGHRIRVRQISEVLKILMQSPEWASAFKASPTLQKRVREELAVDMQAAFGIQREKEMGPQEGGDARWSTDAKRENMQRKPGHRRTVDNNKFDERGPGRDSPPLGDATSSDEWLEASTADGKQYYWNVRTRETRWDPPAPPSSRQSPPPSPPAAPAVSLPPGAGMPGEHGRTQPPSSGKPLDNGSLGGGDHPTTTRGSAAALGTISSMRRGVRVHQGDGPAAKSVPKELAFSAEERASYSEIFDRATRAAAGDKLVTAQFLATSCLPRRALKEIWVVGNPELKPALGREEFSRCCRLIGHCQAVQRGQQQQPRRELEEGGRTLRALLQDRCLGSPPPGPPEFHAMPC